MADRHALDPALVERARAWAAEDPDPETRAELQGLLAAAGLRPDGPEAGDLAGRFAGRLEFGTAGLRGALGAGPMRMNRAVVLRAAAGLAAYLRSQGADGPVVIGYDARRNSDVFARDTAEVVTGAGLRALLLPRPLPTPVLAFAVRELGCAAGVMVTASHNPPQDNGYKVYLGDGCQIVPPADAGIAEAIDRVGPLAAVRRGGAGERVGEEIVERYVAAVAALADDEGPREVRVAYTPLHGVGGALLAQVLRRAGFAQAHTVAAQADPDPAFPTVDFPNPEEPGAMDLALALAEETGADLVLANDPDADRCAVGVPDGHGWRMLTGDELGALLGDLALRQGGDGVYAASIVSSTLLGSMAARHGRRYVETLTGFKWIARVPGLRYGYEEALGYCVAPHLVRDKDGISAALLVIGLAARLRAEGRTLSDRLDELAREHGVHGTDQLSLRVEDLTEIAAAMRRLRSAPPALLGGLAVERVDDLREGGEGLPPTDGLRFLLSGRGRVVVRPSGTEPKLKCYLEVVVPVVGSDVAAARSEAASTLRAVRADLGAALSPRERPVSAPCAPSEPVSAQ